MIFSLVSNSWNHPLFSASQKLGGDFAKFCGLLRIYELYSMKNQKNPFPFFNAHSPGMKFVLPKHLEVPTPYSSRTPEIHLQINVNKYLLFTYRDHLWFGDHLFSQCGYANLSYFNVCHCNQRSNCWRWCLLHDFKIFRYVRY